MEREASTLQVTLTLPDSVAAEARCEGLLEPEALVALIKRELAGRRLQAAWERAAHGPDHEALSMDEIQAIVRRVRREQGRVGVGNA